jgi:hypothetical protein
MEVWRLSVSGDERLRDCCGEGCGKGCGKGFGEGFGREKGGRTEAAMGEGWAAAGWCTLRRVPGANRLSFSFG